MCHGCLSILVACSLVLGEAGWGQPRLSSVPAAEADRGWEHWEETGCGHSGHSGHSGSDTSVDTADTVSQSECGHSGHSGSIRLSDEPCGKQLSLSEPRFYFLSLCSFVFLSFFVYLCLIASLHFASLSIFRFLAIFIPTVFTLVCL